MNTAFYEGIGHYKEEDKERREGPRPYHDALPLYFSRLYPHKTVIVSSYVQYQEGRFSTYRASDYGEIELVREIYQ